MSLVELFIKENKIILWDEKKGVLLLVCKPVNVGSETMLIR